MWDWDKDGHDSLGHAELPLEPGQREGKARLGLQGNASEVEAASAITFAWSLSAAHSGRRVRFTRLACANLRNRDAVGVYGRDRSDPFLRLLAPSGAVVETARRDNSLSPVWDEPYELPLAGSDMSVRVEAWDWDAIGGHDSLGHATLHLLGERGGVSMRLEGGPQEVRRESVVALEWELLEDAAGADGELAGENVLRGTWRAGAPWDVAAAGWSTHARHGWHYCGGWKGGARHGAGACVYPDGSAFVGEWREGAWWGLGSLRVREADCTLTGSFHGRLDHAVADVLLAPSGDRFVGELVRGRRHGTGRCSFGLGAAAGARARADVGGADGGGGSAPPLLLASERPRDAELPPPSGSRPLYEGEWQDDVPHGQGVYSDGASSYVGSWLHGTRHGHGRHSAKGGASYDGEWQHGVQHGCAPHACRHRRRRCCRRARGATAPAAAAR